MDRKGARPRAQMPSPKMDRENCMEQALRDQVIDMMQAVNHMTLATIRADGFPQATTVTFANDGLNILFGCREHSQKAANLMRNQKVSAAISLPFTTWDQIRALSIGGIAHRITDKSEAMAISRVLLQRSPESAEFAQYAMVGVALFKIVPKVIDRPPSSGPTRILV
jgi:pyridoxine/pyridoxamine 5'-phosphate oxidase